MGTRYDGSPREVRALDAYIKLMRASSSVSSRIHGHLREANLTVSQFAVLEAIHHVGPLAQRDLCVKLLQTGGNLTLVVANLEKRGLVRTERPPEDRRLVVVRLTPRGRRLVEGVFPHHAEAVADAFAILTVAEQKELSRLLRKLGQHS